MSALISITELTLLSRHNITPHLIPPHSCPPNLCLLSCQQTDPSYLHPLLHRSTAPLCLHAYALTSRGASRVLSLLNNPWTAYSTAVDTAVPSFISFSQDPTGALLPSGRLLEAFTVDPPLIIQRKDGPSDIQEGVGSKWRGLLSDSTVERIKKSEGEWTDEDEREASVWDERRALDPATVYRYGAKKCHA